MSPEEVKQVVLGRMLSVPYSIVTRSGLHYPIVDHANAFITPAYPETLIVAVPGKGIALVGLTSIDAIHAEHEPTPDRA